MKICIVGGGLAGASLALHLRRHPRAAAITSLTVCEPHRELGRGVAYATPFASHLLNVRHGNMSVLADDAGHFSRWLAARRGPSGDAFVARRLYGDYLEETLAPLLRCGAIVHRRDAVVRLGAAGPPGLLQLACGRRLHAERLALCPGNRPAWPASLAPLAALPPALQVASAWDWQRLRQLPRDADLLAMGSGLSMVDVWLALQEIGFTGRLIALSRHGLAPLAHPASPGPAPSAEASLDAVAPHRLLRQLRQAAQKGPWQACIDALRASTPARWRRLTAAQQGSFLRHAKAYWDVHRHRIAPQVAAQLAAAQASGKLLIVAGRLLDAAAQGDAVVVRLRRRSGAPWTLRAAAAINCCGTALRWQRGDSALAAALLDLRLARPCSLGLGLQTDATGALLDATGQPRDALAALGCLRVGADLESVAVPEIRQQAAQLADRWLAR